MNSKQLLLLAACLLPFLVSAQEIDASVAKSLGLVPAADQSAFKPIGLVVGKPTEIVFPESGKLKIKALAKESLDIINANNRLIITPHKPLVGDSTGIFDLSLSGQSVLLRFTMVEDSEYKNVVRIGDARTLPPVRVVPAKKPRTIFAPGAGRVKTTNFDEYVSLAAFAARVAYAPNRLVSPPRGISSVAVNSSDRDVRRIFREGRVKLSVLSSWHHKNLFVTIVQMENRGASDIRLTPEMVRGRFIGKSFHRTIIGVDDMDRFTSMYLISEFPFDSILGEL
jgi:hypothetical protein